ncbi:MAG: hypothetical protein AVO33_03895 [delta proteobacterium ML8_F1]|nr:MAG: hypothetical protein AVO33_03895 [delta proteobacterium ML8_F1]
MRILIKGGSVADFKTNRFLKRDLLIQEGVIRKIGQNLLPEAADQVVEAEGLYVSPGFIDAHVHLREPGGEHKETIETGTRACAAGGFTHVFAMPNTSPSPDSVGHLKDLYRRIEKSALIKVTPIASVTRGIAGEELVDLEALSREDIGGFSDDGHPVTKVDYVYQVLLNSVKTHKPLITHSEDLSTFEVGAVNRGPLSEFFGVDGIPNEAETNMVARDVAILEETSGHLHICHVSAKETVEVIREAKLRGLKVTCEVTPHHFSLTEEMLYHKGTQAKVNPPLRKKEDVQRIIAGIQEGTVDIIATDHAPHDRASKETDMERASYGFTGAELAFSIGYTYLVRQRHIDLMTLLRLMSYNPAKIFGLEQEGEIIEGGLGNLVLLDLTTGFRVEASKLLSKGKNTPFDGSLLYGRVKKTLYQGRWVYEEE